MQSQEHSAKELRPRIQPSQGPKLSPRWKFSLSNQQQKTWVQTMQLQVSGWTIVSFQSGEKTLPCINTRRSWPRTAPTCQLHLHRLHLNLEPSKKLLSCSWLQPWLPGRASLWRPSTSDFQQQVGWSICFSSSVVPLILAWSSERLALRGFPL